MSQTTVLNVEIREATGTGAARAVRRENLIPGVIYGGDGGPVAISLRKNEITRAINSGNFLSTMFEIDHSGKRQPVIARELQVHPVSDQPLHVDLMRIEKDTLLNVDVSVHFSNEEESPGLKRGGTLNIVRHEVEVLCPANSIPEILEADLTGLDIGDAIHISNIKLPKGVKPSIQDRDFTIATIVAPSSVKSDEDEAADAEATSEAEVASEDDA